MQNNSYFDLLNHQLKRVNLIEASAGTGKTYNIAGLFLRFLLEQKLSIRDILVVTFSEAATEELKDRIRKAIGLMLDLVNQKVREEADAKKRESNSPGSAAAEEDQHGFVMERISKDIDEIYLHLLDKVKDNYDKASLELKRALVDFDEANIFTIHSFCRRMLNDNAFESGILFDVELIKSEDEIRQEIVEDFWRKNISDLPAHELKLLTGSSGDISISALIRLAEQVIDLSDIKIVPDLKLDKERTEAEWKKIFIEIKKIWKEHSEEILKDFQDQKRYHARNYNLETIRNDFMNFSQFLDGPEVPAKFDRLDKFTMPVITKNTNGKFSPPEDKFSFFEKCGALLEIQKTYDNLALDLKLRFIHFVEEELRERKQKRNVQSFNDLLINLRTALRSKESGERLAEAIRTRFKAALIDEFQDTDPIQFEIFQTIFSNNKNILFLIGDPKQAIYGFRGADIFAYLKASENPEYVKRTLGTNFRSQDDLIQAVNLIFARENPFIYDEIKYYEIAAPEDEDKKIDRLFVDDAPYTPMHIWNMTDEIYRGDQSLFRQGEIDAIGHCVAAEIKRLLKLGKAGRAKIGERKVEEKDFAVLVRTNSQAARAQKKLAEFGIPSVIYNSGNIFQSHEAVETERVLSCIEEPGNMGLVKAALATDLLGLPCEYIDRLSEDESLYEEWLEKFKKYNRQWHSSGFIKMFRELLNDEISTDTDKSAVTDGKSGSDTSTNGDKSTGMNKSADSDDKTWEIMPRLMKASDGERRNTNILHLMELLHQAEADERLSPQGLIKWLHERMDEDDSENEEHQMRLESDEKAVKIVTIHKSKGLEYSIVFIPFIWNGSKDRPEFKFHDRQNGDILTWELGSPDKKKNTDAFKQEKLAEYLRLFYVAVTRAKNCCYIVLNKVISKSLRSGIQEHIFNDTEICRITEAANGNMILCDMPVNNDPGLMLTDDKDELQLQERRLKNNIDKKRLIASYTSLSRRFAEADIRVEIESISESTTEEEVIDAEEKFTQFTFNKGHHSGICLHEILEKADYTSADLSELVEEMLDKFRFKKEFAPAVCGMIANTLSAPLNGGMMLKDIPSEKRIHEMEFYFPLGTISSRSLSGIFKDAYSEDTRLYDFYKYLTDLRGDEIEGFMNGFLDLLFEHEGRYYIADWKSNHLGNNTASYSQNMLLHTMKEELYIMQYHIYCVAVHQFLRTTLSDYDYERDFGGVYYLFLRGIDKEAGEDNGIYYHKPPRQAIEKLAEYLIKNGKENA